MVWNFDNWLVVVWDVFLFNSLFIFGFWKGFFGDDDMFERDNFGERRWKYEFRVLVGVGIKSVDDDVNFENKFESFGNDSREDDVEGNNSEIDGFEDEFFK